MQLKQFRCLSATSLSFSSRLIVIEGPNGSGKTSILEALYYAGHLRSFKTAAPKELIQHDADSFFIRLHGDTKSGESWHIHAGYSQDKRVIKINDTPAKTYRDLYATYQVISITEDDMALVQGYPETRRSFMDDAISAQSEEYRILLKKYRKVLEQRNALLTQYTISDESYILWTDQLTELTARIHAERIAFLQRVEARVNRLLEDYCGFSGNEVALIYAAKQIQHSDLKMQEIRAKKTLFGAHLDDFTCTFIGKKAKSFASRGQQKLLAVIMKIAAAEDLASYVMLLDDFVTDFDEQRVRSLIRLVAAKSAQCIFTIPATKGILHDALAEYPHQIIRLDCAI